MNKNGAPFIALAGFSLGTSFVAARFGVGQFHPFVYVTIRLSLAAAGYLLLYLLLSRFRLPTNGRVWRVSTVLGLFTMAVPMVAYMSALRHISSGVASMFSAAGPALTLLLANFLLPDEPLTRRKLAGIGLALGGALLLVLLGENGLDSGSETAWLGYAYTFVGMVAVSAGTISIRKFTLDFEPFDVNAIQVLVAALAVGLLTAVSVGYDFSQVTWQGVFAVSYSGIIGSFLAFFLFLYTAQKFGATAAASTSYIIPVVATIAGALVLGEQITLGMVVCIVVIIGGTILLNSQPSGKKEGTAVTAVPGD